VHGISHLALYNEIGNEVLLIKYIDRAPSSQNDSLVH
jgi:hypothetical protein